MSDWTTINDSELRLIKEKMNRKFINAMKITLVFTIPLCLYSPYIRGKNGHRMIDSMEYTSAVILFSIIWICCLIGVYIWNTNKVNSQYNRALVYLKKKEVNTEVITLSKSFLSRYYNIVEAEIENNLEKINIDQDFSKQLKIGDKLKIKIEENTRTILAIEKEQPVLTSATQQQGW